MPSMTPSKSVMMQLQRPQLLVIQISLFTDANTALLRTGRQLSARYLARAGRNSSSVSGSFTSKDERAKAVEITYNDADNDYKIHKFTLRSDDFGTSNTQDNTAQLTLFGVARRSQAYREAIKALATNERQLQSVELSTDIDGITAEYGDVVGYTHAISKIGIASGRIVSATATTVKLDKTVDILASQTYEIYVQLSNDKLVKREVVPVSITTDTLTVTQPFDSDDIPQLYDCYSFW